MATNNGSKESSPLLSKQIGFTEDENKKLNGKVTAFGWTVDGLPLVQGSVVGEPMGRSKWSSSLFDCLGHNDEFCSSDIEVCILGTIAPCVLYGSNAKRLESAPSSAFQDSCLTYSGLCLFGNCCIFNFFTSWLSYTTRSAIRQKLNLEGSCEALNRSWGCCGSCMEDDARREQCESTCDFATHVFCHACALCQEGRELRRKLPSPGFTPRPVLVRIPPGEQTMVRGSI